MKHSLLRRVLVLVLCLCLSLPLLGSARAASGTYGGLSWTLEDGTLTIRGQHDLSTMFVPDLPEGTTIHTVVIGEGITEVAGGALNTTLLSGVKTVYLPASATTVNHYGFPASLQNIHVAADNPVYRSVDGVLFQWEELVLYPAGRTDTAYTVPEGTFSIGRNAFSNNHFLVKITLPDSLTSIGDSAFFPCHSLYQIQFGTGLTHIGYGSFRECTSLTKLALPASVETIDQRAFQDCCALNAVTFAGNPRSIGNYAFLNCTSLEQIALPRITSVSYYTFSNSGLKHVFIPDSVTYIGANAFGGKLEQVSYGGTEAQWNAISIETYEYYNPTNKPLLNAFKCYNQTGLSAQTKPQIPKAVIPAGVEDHGYLNDEQTVAWYFRDGVLTITGQGAIPNYSDDTPKAWTRCRDELSWGYKALVIEEGITSIGSQAFSSKGFGFGSVQLPSTLQSIGWGAFSQAGGFDTLVIPDSVNSIGTSAFSGTDLEHVTLPSGLVKIPNTAFAGCVRLKRITIPATVQFIGTKAFTEHCGVTDVYFCGTEAQWNAIQKSNAFVSPEYYTPPTVHFNSLTFCDVYPDKWFYPYVKDLTDAGVINGMSKTAYDPNGTLTYAQALKLITLAVGESEQAALPGQGWASGYLKLARDRGWITGEVNLNTAISRLELCRIAAAALKLTEQPRQNPFTDTADPAILALYQAGIINGMTPTTFAPQENLTRAQIAKIIWCINQM